MSQLTLSGRSEVERSTWTAGVRSVRWTAGEPGGQQECVLSGEQQVNQVDSRSALAKSMERAAKQQELSDGYRALFGDLPASTYTTRTLSTLSTRSRLFIVIVIIYYLLR